MDPKPFRPRPLRGPLRGGYPNEWVKKATSKAKEFASNKQLSGNAFDTVVMRELNRMEADYNQRYHVFQHGKAMRYSRSYSTPMGTTKFVPIRDASGQQMRDSKGRAMSTKVSTLVQTTGAGRGSVADPTKTLGARRVAKREAKAKEARSARARTRTFEVTKDGDVVDSTTRRPMPGARAGSRIDSPTPSPMGPHPSVPQWRKGGALFSAKLSPERAAMRAYLKLSRADGKEPTHLELMEIGRQAGIKAKSERDAESIKAQQMGRNEAKSQFRSRLRGRRMVKRNKTQTILRVSQRMAKSGIVRTLQDAGLSGQHAEPGVQITAGRAVLDEIRTQLENPKSEHRAELEQAQHLIQAHVHSAEKQANARLEQRLRSQKDLINRSYDASAAARDEPARARRVIAALDRGERIASVGDDFWKTEAGDLVRESDVLGHARRSKPAATPAQAPLKAHPRILRALADAEAKKGAPRTIKGSSRRSMMQPILEITEGSSGERINIHRVMAISTFHPVYKKVMERIHGVSPGGGVKFPAVGGANVQEIVRQASIFSLKGGSRFGLGLGEVLITPEMWPHLHGIGAGSRGFSQTIQSKDMRKMLKMGRSAPASIKGNQTFVVRAVSERFLTEDELSGLISNADDFLKNYNGPITRQALGAAIKMDGPRATGERIRPGQGGSPGGFKTMGGRGRFYNLIANKMLEVREGAFGSSQTYDSMEGYSSDEETAKELRRIQNRMHSDGRGAARAMPMSQRLFANSMMRRAFPKDIVGPRVIRNGVPTVTVVKQRSLVGMPRLGHKGGEQGIMNRSISRTLSSIGGRAMPDLGVGPTQDARRAAFAPGDNVRPEVIERAHTVGIDAVRIVDVNNMGNLSRGLPGIMRDTANLLTATMYKATMETWARRGVEPGWKRNAPWTSMRKGGDSPGYETGALAKALNVVRSEDDQSGQGGSREWRRFLGWDSTPHPVDSADLRKNDDEPFTMASLAALNEYGGVHGTDPHTGQPTIIPSRPWLSRAADLFGPNALDDSARYLGQRIAKYGFQSSITGSVAAARGASLANRRGLTKGGTVGSTAGTRAVISARRMASTPSGTYTGSKAEAAGIAGKGVGTSPGEIGGGVNYDDFETKF